MTKNSVLYRIMGKAYCSTSTILYVMLLNIYICWWFGDIESLESAVITLIGLSHLWIGCLCFKLNWKMIYALEITAYHSWESLCVWVENWSCQLGHIFPWYSEDRWMYDGSGGRKETSSGARHCGQHAKLHKQEEYFLISSSLSIRHITSSHCWGYYLATLAC